jgi:hypothetical protein
MPEFTEKMVQQIYAPFSFTYYINLIIKYTSMENNEFYIGMWVTKDGYIRHELLPGGRYDEARGNRRSAYQGNYKMTGNHIDYKDDTGFTADGNFIDGILYHAGMVLYKEDQK